MRGSLRLRHMRSRNRLFPARLDPSWWSDPGKWEFLDNCPSIMLPLWDGLSLHIPSSLANGGTPSKVRYPAAGTHYPHRRIQSLLSPIVKPSSLEQVQQKEGSLIGILPGLNAATDPRCRMGDPCASPAGGEAYAWFLGHVLPRLRPFNLSELGKAFSASGAELWLVSMAWLELGLPRHDYVVLPTGTPWLARRRNLVRPTRKAS
ncbi:hypothetical protein EDD37DRAFT_415760 [Exophiala viscosa]|uniref:uncharacterized protein n=1 Tax=Exophiala viscosa TaxID=2486360 RepID=UPI0021A09CCE|nr:hypothetical protein EDD37DRAFT_415760 [Exophiala viscosa]